MKHAGSAKIPFHSCRELILPHLLVVRAGSIVVFAAWPRRVGKFGMIRVGMISGQSKRRQPTIRLIVLLHIHIVGKQASVASQPDRQGWRKTPRSEEHTSELQS